MPVNHEESSTRGTANPHRAPSKRRQPPQSTRWPLPRAFVDAVESTEAAHLAEAGHLVEEEAAHLAEEAAHLAGHQEAGREAECLA